MPDSRGWAGRSSNWAHIGGDGGHWHLQTTFKQPLPQPPDDGNQPCVDGRTAETDLNGLILVRAPPVLPEYASL